MSDAPTEPPRKTLPVWLRNLIIGVALGVPAVLGARALVEWDQRDVAAHGGSPGGVVDPADERRVDEAVKSLLPNIYQQMVEAKAQGDVAPGEVLHAAIAESGLDDIPKASDATLADFAHTRLAVLRLLAAQNLKGCASYYVQGGMDHKDISAQQNHLMADNVIVMLHAISEGASHPVTRVARTPADRAALYNELVRAGVDAPTRNLMFRPSEAVAATPEDQCRAGVAFYEAVSRLPLDVQGRTVADIMMAGPPSQRALAAQPTSATDATN